MKFRIPTACLVCLLFWSLLAPRPGLAVPREVTLFPASAQVLETAKLKAVSEGNLKKATFTLPAQADPASLVTRLNQAGNTRIVDQAKKWFWSSSETLGRTKRCIRITRTRGI